jgi:TonB family protein
MHAPSLHADDVFTPREVARASGVSEAEVLALVARGEVRTVGSGRFMSRGEAVRVGRALVSKRAADATVPAAMFSLGRASSSTARVPFAASGMAHAAVVSTLVAATTLGLGRTTTLADSRDEVKPARLVFLALPGPGGGGGGGGLRQKLAPPRAERKGTQSLDSPLPVRRAPEPPRPVERPKDPEPPKTPTEPLPPVQAPVVAAPSDERTHAGVLEQTTAQNESRGPGTGGGAGTGRGTGLGEGEGSGIGEGSGGGTGGGPYRPGSGVEPPSLIHEVRPDYTEQARQRSVEGEVVMEIVVRRDGSVGDVRVLQGLGHGLDERAVQAVRQWRFSPAQRKGIAVDVMVEVAMEFRIR